MRMSLIEATPGKERWGSPTGTPAIPRTPRAPGLPLGILAAVVFFSCCLTSPASAQAFSRDRFSLEPRFGMAFPAGDFGDVDPACPPGSVGCDYPTQIGTDPGWRWEVAAHYAVADRWSLVAGFGQTRLGCSASFCGTSVDPGTRNLALGVRAHALPLGSMDLWIEGGGVLEEATIIRTLDLVGEPSARKVRYPWSPGVYLGAGASLPLRGDGDLFFTPGFRFHYVTADPPDSDLDLRSIDITYAVAEVGVKILLGK